MADASEINRATVDADINETLSDRIVEENGRTTGSSLGLRRFACSLLAVGPRTEGLRVGCSCLRLRRVLFSHHRVVPPPWRRNGEGVFGRAQDNGFTEKKWRSSSDGGPVRCNSILPVTCWTRTSTPRDRFIQDVVASRNGPAFVSNPTVKWLAAFALTPPPSHQENVGPDWTTKGLFTTLSSLTRSPKPAGTRNPGRQIFFLSLTCSVDANFD